MSVDAAEKIWFADFRRTLRYLWPHRRLMMIGLISALGVGIFFTFSISSVVPLLKVLFARHETLPDWLNRIETERRLGVSLDTDAPDDPNGLYIKEVKADSRSASVISNRDRIESIAGQKYSAYEATRLLAGTPERNLSVVLRSYDDKPRTVQLTLRARHFWSSLPQSLAVYIPTGRDAGARLYALIAVMLGLVIVALLGGLCRFANEGLVAAAVQRAMHDLRTHLADHVMRLPMGWHTANPPGDTLGRFATDIAKVEVGLSTLFGKTIREPLKAIGVLVLTVLIDWKLLLLGLVGLPIVAVVIRVFGRIIKKAQKRASQSWGRLLDHLGERLAGVRVVKAYNMQAAESRRFQAEGQTLTTAQTHIELADAASNPALEVLAIIGVSMFVIYGGSRVFQDQLEPNLFFATVICLAGMFEPVRKLGNVYNRVQQADASARRLWDLIDARTEDQAASETSAALGTSGAKSLGAPQRAPAGEAAAVVPFEHTIEFRNLTFSYPSTGSGTIARPVLEGISLTVRKGQVVALVGPNGSGKTTLISLLLRFYEPDAGGIFFDGRDIREFSLAALRAQIGLVTQDSVIFSDTVRNNIAYGQSQMDEAAILRAAQRAHIDDFITTLRVPHNGTVLAGYDAPITSRSLSGGQKQRLALARAILRDPPILILDEATSQIDSESERKIQEAIEDVTRDRTTFIIAHRFSTIAHADLTIVLNEGKLIAAGRHAELLEVSPFYVKLCESQFASVMG